MDLHTDSSDSIDTMPIRSILGEVLSGWTISEAATESGMERHCMSDIWGHKKRSPRASVRFTTMDKVYETFHLRPGDWLVHDTAALPALIASHGGTVRVVLGEHRVRLVPKPGFEANPNSKDVARKAVDVWDTRALVEVARSSPVNPEISHCGYSLHVSQREVQEGRALPGSLQSHTSGVLLSVGSPLSSGYADYALARIHNAKWDVPITFHWGCAGEGVRPYSKFGTRNRGIKWDDERRSEMISVPSWQAISNLPPKTDYDDVAAIVLQRVPDAHALVVLVMGFMGPATYAAAKFLSSKEFSRLSTVYCNDVSRSERPEPHFSLWRVRCSTGPTAAADVIPDVPKLVASMGPKDYR